MNRGSSDHLRPLHDCTQSKPRPTSRGDPWSRPRDDVTTLPGPPSRKEEGRFATRAGRVLEAQGSGGTASASTAIVPIRSQVEDRQNQIQEAGPDLPVQGVEERNCC